MSTIPLTSPGEHPPPPWRRLIETWPGLALVATAIFASGVGLAGWIGAPAQLERTVQRTEQLERRIVLLELQSTEVLLKIDRVLCMMEAEQGLHSWQECLRGNTP
jgi:hypothetical protein